MGPFTAALLGEQGRVGGDAVDDSQGRRFANLLQACRIQEDLHECLLRGMISPRGKVLTRP